jgi:LysM repeat protein
VLLCRTRVLSGPVIRTGTCLGLGVLLGALALAVLAGLGAPGPGPTPVAAPTPHSLLPMTQPGLSAEEGVFLITAANDGSSAVYFIAQNTRHSISPGDMQFEQQINPLWPVRIVDRDVVLAFGEAAPVGSAPVGLLNALATDNPTSAEDEPGAGDAPAAAAEPPAAAGEPPPVAEEPPVLAEHPTPAAPPHVAGVPAASGGQPPAADAQPVALQASLTYVVRAGDNLTRLSGSNGTTVQAIVHANGIRNANLIYIGQTISIPITSVASAPADPVLVAETPEAAEVQPAPLDPSPIYIVRAGDTLNRLSAQRGTTVQAIVKANDIANPDLIHTGQRVSIPIPSAAPERVEQTVVADEPIVVDQPVSTAVAVPTASPARPIAAAPPAPPVASVVVEPGAAVRWTSPGSTASPAGVCTNVSLRRFARCP